MPMMRERRPAYRTVEGWAIGVLLEEGAIKQCHDHGYIQCRGDPHARARAFAIALGVPPEGLSSEEAAAALHDVLGGVGDACPEC